MHETLSVGVQRERAHRDVVDVSRIREVHDGGTVQIRAHKLGTHAKRACA